MTGDVFTQGGGLLALLLILLPLALAIYCTVDVVRQPALTTGQKTGWAAGFLLGWLVFEVVGFVLALVYLIAVRPKLRR
jgi:hypothetical protein